MKGTEIRKAFLDYFASKGHTVVPSSSLVPTNDPTLLFSNAGMNQFKDCFLGNETRDYVRAASSQKCMRISGKHNDLENVGVSASHHTFFEMLGNFSFGDYFKKEAIQFAWEFSTEVLKLPKSRIWVTIFVEDDEAFELWCSETDIDSKRVVRLGEKENFWAMGDTGPCGPCSELHYFIGEDESTQSAAGLENDDGTFLEFWNLVFMQYNRASDGKLEPLPSPSVDTGMGLERMASILQDKPGNYDTDLLRDVITVCEKLSGKKYVGKSYEVRDLKTDKEYACDVAMRVIADHSRAVAFLIADGVMPGSDGRGYVLRRIIRRAVRYGRMLDFKEPFLAKTCSKVIEIMSGQYPELTAQEDIILKTANAEEEKFYETIDAGLQILDKELSKLKSGQKFPGQTAFTLHDTYGFPLDLTQVILKTDNIEVDLKGFKQAMDQQKNRSRADRKAKGIEFSSVKIKGKQTNFLGYENTEADSKLVQVIEQDGKHLSLVFKDTPFYAEAGGQVSDTGRIEFKDCKLEVHDVQKVQDKFFVHDCSILEGDFSEKLVGQKAALSVDAERRNKIRVNHSATHILHSALREVLGEHVKQAGSRVDDFSLRFDYSHFEPVSAAQLDAIHEFVNDYSRNNYEVVTKEMKLEEARKRGAMALFGEKYADVVRVVEIGPSSLELCGGTHVTRSGDIGFLLVDYETGVSSGVRRIECFAGANAHAAMLKHNAERLAIAHLLKGDDRDLHLKVEKLIAHNKKLEREIEELKQKIAGDASGNLVSNTRTSPAGIKVIVESVDVSDTQTLRSMVDRLRLKLGSGVVALGTSDGEKASIIAGVTADLTDKIHAGNLVKEAAKVTGGRGGGRADFAQAGGLDSKQLQKALDKVFELIG